MDTKNVRIDRSIENVLRLVKPILVEKELMGRRMTMVEFSRLCHNYRSRLPLFRSYGAKRLIEDINSSFKGASCFRFEDMDISLFLDRDHNERQKWFIEIGYSVSLERQYLDSLAQAAVEDLV